MDMAQAACVPIPFGTADDCLFEFGRLQAGETVLVHAGAGGVGLAAIQLAKRAGAKVLPSTTTRSPWTEAETRAGGAPGSSLAQRPLAVAQQKLPPQSSLLSQFTRNMTHMPALDWHVPLPTDVS